MAAAHRIKRKFRELRTRGEAALIPFIVAGDPDMDTTRRLVLELEARGADLIELGVPFSDPMADGPANQRALSLRTRDALLDEDWARARRWRRFSRW